MVEISKGVHAMTFTKLLTAAGLSATLIGTSLALPVDVLASGRGNRVSRNAGNRQGNRQSARNNRQTTVNENRNTRINNRGVGEESTPTTARIW